MDNTIKIDETFSFTGVGTIFDYANSLVTTNDFGIDQTLKLKNPPDPVILLDLPFHEIEDDPYYNLGFKPFAIYAKYLKSVTTLTRQTFKFPKYRGSTVAFDNDKIKHVARYESKFDIQTKYNYTESTLTNPAVLEWEAQVDPGKYTAWQTVMIYALRGDLGFDEDKKKEKKKSDERKEEKEGTIGGSLLPPVIYKGNHSYHLFAVYRDDCYLIKNKEQIYKPPEFNVFVESIFDRGFTRCIDLDFKP
ncbi:hypothetical protein DFA_08868 [Cavenderia fasciculata]|uniref:Monalysin Pore-forming domain-containing protein n=1 Tax=Cavenderia fasciculata TaxID=261658 RepID=F4Q4S1_CACFS|nr:uncharacterized protein DFA_08868 [Cavenderia fasciculata]EGG17867.1 hypothetical protein DFA_08868 [Cavenderia fasciculata]|eukprot:XP_004356351.1 hypothetical protein DFA_08868 [Cavenderia fasciculata]